jgi:hypothetical protein
MKDKYHFLSRNEINEILQIAGNFSEKGIISMGDLIHVLYLFEDKDKTERERKDFLKSLKSE